MVALKLAAMQPPTAVALRSAPMRLPFRIVCCGGEGTGLQSPWLDVTALCSGM
jgi:hypothetical protein